MIIIIYSHRPYRNHGNRQDDDYIRAAIAQYKLISKLIKKKLVYSRTGILMSMIIIIIEYRLYNRLTHLNFKRLLIKL